MKLKSLLFAALAVASMSAMAETTAGTDEMFIKDFEMKAGESKTVDVLFKNATAYSALQAVIFSPEAVEIVPTFEEGSDIAWLDPVGRSVSNPRALVSYTTNAILADPNKHVSHELRLVGVQMSNKAVLTSVTEGEPIFQIKISVPETATAGTYECSIDKLHYSTGIPGGVGDGDGPKTTFKIKVSTSGVDNVTTAKEVSSVKYINLAGVESAQPFDGVNVVVTTYTDGSKATSKVVK